MISKSAVLVRKPSLNHPSRLLPLALQTLTAAGAANKGTGGLADIAMLSKLGVGGAANATGMVGGQGSHIAHTHSDCIPYALLTEACAL